MPEDRLTMLENQVQQLTELLTSYLRQNEQHRPHMPPQQAEHQSPSLTREPHQSRQSGQEIHPSEAAGSTSSPSRERGTSQERRLRFLEKQVQELKKGKEELPHLGSNQPLNKGIMSEVPPERFRIPSIKLYDGSTDPYDHVELFSSHMLMQSGLTRCGAGWEELKTCFLAHYAPLKRHRKSSMALVNTKQNQGESLRDFVARFNEEALSIDEFDQWIAMVALQNGLRDGPFAQSLAKTPPRTFTEALTRANKYINAEEVMKVKRAEQPDKKEREKEKKKPMGEQKMDYRPSQAPDRRGFGGARGSPSPPNTRSKKKYCRFHRDHGYETNDCIQLKEEIHELINRGYLWDFVSRGGVNSSRVESQLEQRRRSPTRDRFREQSQTPPRREGKQLIEEGGHKFILYMLAVGTVLRPHSTAPKSVVKEKVVITFSEEDLPSYPNYSDPLVITAQVEEWEMRRILVDPGSSSEILYKRAFLGMGFTLDQLRPVRVYNTRCYRSGLNALRAVPSTYHMVLKFPTLGGIDKVRGDQRQARECYVASLSATIAKGSESNSRLNQDAVPQDGQG
ncbi:uncharacterized protein LOC127787474 [Diospyros lotus]|uniref:uncharacterized protein LOC127787474 n=1 Tax=Diospyros lotus TaxID=55363 RepID=UPI00225944FD|nr:uncharacterized protein LOC127787474 [Diospyros lotus]